MILKQLSSKRRENTKYAVKSKLTLTQMFMKNSNRRSRRNILIYFQDFFFKFLPDDKALGMQKIIKNVEISQRNCLARTYIKEKKCPLSSKQTCFHAECGLRSSINH
jgi:hypothetical protein